MNLLPSAKTKNAKRNGTQTNKLLLQIFRDRQLYLLLIPFLLYYILFVFRPMGGMVIAFKDYGLYKGIAGSRWVGLKHFREFFQSEFFGRTLKNTLFISLYQLLFGFPLPIILALLLNEVSSKKYKSVVQTFSYIPYFVSTVVIAGMVTLFLSPSNGVVNIILSKLGFDKIYFLTKPEYFRSIYTITNIWVGLGYNSIVYISALSGVDQELYEAAKIDGAGKLKQIWYISLPSIKPMIIIMTILKIGKIFYGDFGLFYNFTLNSSLLYSTTDIIDTYVYRSLITLGDVGMSSAAGFYQAVLGFILVITTNFIVNKIDSDNALF